MSYKKKGILQMLRRKRHQDISYLKRCRPITTFSDGDGFQSSHKRVQYKKFYPGKRGEHV